MTDIVPDQKVYIVKAARTDLSIVYPDRYAVRLGTVQLSWAIASIIIEVIGLVQGSYPWVIGILTGVIFLVCGGLTIARGKTGNR